MIASLLAQKYKDLITFNKENFQTHITMIKKLSKDFENKTNSNIIETKRNETDSNSLLELCFRDLRL